MEWWSNGVVEYWSVGVSAIGYWLLAIFHYAQVYLSIRGFCCFWVRRCDRKSVNAACRGTRSRVPVV